MASREAEASLITQLFERLARLEKRMEALSRRVDDLAHRVGALSGEMRSLRLRVDTMLLAMVGLIATLAIKL